MKTKQLKQTFREQNAFLPLFFYIGKPEKRHFPYLFAKSGSFAAEIFGCRTKSESVSHRVGSRVEGLVLRGRNFFVGFDTHSKKNLYLCVSKGSQSLCNVSDEKGRWVKIPHSPRCCKSTTLRSCMLLKIFATDPLGVGKASAMDKSEDLPWRLGIFTCGGREKSSELITE